MLLLLPLPLPLLLLLPVLFLLLSLLLLRLLDQIPSRPLGPHHLGNEYGMDGSLPLAKLRKNLRDQVKRKEKVGGHRI